MTMPPDKTTAALDDDGSEPRLNASEWAAITKFHKKGYDEKNWTQKEKVDLTSALNKAYGPTSVLRVADSATLRKWMEKVGFLG